MCGIAGYICMSNKRPDKTNLEEMFKSIELRGKDASGFAYFKDNQLRVAKAPLTATQLITKKSWRQLKNLPPIMIMHTRAATQGVETENSNNHPIIHEHYAMVHNGVISNEDEFDVPNTVVDSLAILKAWHKYDGKIEDVFNSIQGSYAVAILDSNRQNTLTLFRHTNPMEILFDKDDEILYFASTTWATGKNKVEYKKKFKGIPIHDRYHAFELPNNAFLELSIENGVEVFKKDLVPKPIIYKYESKYDNWKGYKGWRHNTYDDSDEYYYDTYPNKQLKAADTTKADKKEEIPQSDALFLEYLEPQTIEDYKKVNEKLATSWYKAIECPACQRPTIIIDNIMNPVCHQCKKIIKQGETNVN